MRVLSWDIGIINLAYCLIDYEKTTNVFKIIDWGIINLTDRDKMKCFHCNANPKYYQENTKQYSCKNHDKLLNTTPQLFEILFSDNITNLCSYMGKTKCDKKSKFIHNDTNEYFCNTHGKNKYKQICNTYKLIPHSKKAVGKQSMDDFRLRLIKELEERPNLLLCELVFIENQPSLKNPKMKTISGCVYDYYMIRGIFDKHLNDSLINEVHFMSPSNKLKLADNGDTKELVKLKGDDSKTYKLTKQLSIKYCTEMIEQYPEWLKIFKSYKKKDDMADCFLQGMYAVMNR